MERPAAASSSSHWEAAPAASSGSMQWEEPAGAKYPWLKRGTGSYNPQNVMGGRGVALGGLYQENISYIYIYIHTHIYIYTHPLIYIYIFIYTPADIVLTIHPIRVDRVEDGVRVFRKEEVLGEGHIHIGNGLVCVYKIKGVKEWDGRVLRAWVEAGRVFLVLTQRWPVCSTMLRSGWAV